MDDLDEIRQRKLRELQERQQQGGGDQDAATQEAEEADARERAAIERILQQVLDGEARERLTRIRMSRPELADALSRQLVTLVQQGRLKSRLSDADLRNMLAQIAPKDRDIQIKRK